MIFMQQSVLDMYSRTFSNTLTLSNVFSYHFWNTHWWALANRLIILLTCRHLSYGIYLQHVEKCMTHRVEPPPSEMTVPDSTLENEPSVLQQKTKLLKQILKHKAWAPEEVIEHSGHLYSYRCLCKTWWSHSSFGLQYLFW